MSRSAINEVMARTNKKYGAGTLVRGSEVKRRTFPRCTTGSLSFDFMLGGGWPLNQWNEVVGNESNGKTVLVLKTIAANMALDPTYEVLWVASEHFVADWAETLGVDLDRVILCETNVMEEAYDVVVDAMDSQAVDAVVIDSLPALIPGEEAEKTMVEWQVGLGARMTNKFMRKAGKAQKRSLVEVERDCLGIIINQWRTKVGLVFGDPRTTPGGKGKDFSYFTKVEVARDSWLTDVDPNLPEGAESKKDYKVGLAIKAKTSKNKTAPPYRTGQVDFYFEPSGHFKPGDFDWAKEILTMGMAYDVITRGGASGKGGAYVYGDRSWRVRRELETDLYAEAELREEIRREILRLSLPEHVRERPDALPAPKPRPRKKAA